MSFDIDISKVVGDRTIALQCRSDHGLIALVGPSGAGKTSILHMIAGLSRPDRGRIVVAGETLFDSATGINLTPARRRAGYVFQDRRLFPHMRVRANLLYGRGADVGRALHEVVAFLGIDHLLDRLPASLSGGEAQRVAIGRALLSGPRFLLLDEPLSSVDPRRKAEILDAIDDIRSRSAIPIIYVTHVIAEAERLLAEVIPISEQATEAMPSAAIPAKL